MNADSPLPIPEATAPEAYTVEQAAAALGISTRLVRDLCASGRLPAVDLGSGRYRMWRIGRDAIQQLLASGPQVDRNLIP